MVESNHLFFNFEGQENLPIADRGQGIYLYDTDGSRYLDGSSQAFAAILGHGNRDIKKAIVHQFEKVDFVHRFEFLNSPAAELANMIYSKTGGRFSRLFYASSGSEAVDTALKLAYYYHFAANNGTRWKIISRVPGFHGATMGALSVTADYGRNHPYGIYNHDFPKISAPYCYRCPYDLEPESCALKCTNELERVIELYGKNSISAFICESIGGTPTGAIQPPEGYYERIRAICNHYGILWIDDEVLTGYGRTGKFLAVDWWDAKPDIITVSKGISGGYLPLAAVLCQEELFQKTLGSGGFNHGHTQSANPLCCAVGMEVLKILEKKNLIENCLVQGERLGQALADLKRQFKIIGDIRGKGLLWGMEFVRDRKTKDPFPKRLNVAKKLKEICRDNGLSLFSSNPIDGVKGDCVIIAPPLIIKGHEIDELAEILEKSLASLSDLLKQ